MPDKKPVNWLQYSGIGTQMLITIILFWWLGGKLENHFKLFSEPWGQLLGLFFGIFSGLNFSDPVCMDFGFIIFSSLNRRSGVSNEICVDIFTSAI